MLSAQPKQRALLALCLLATLCAGFFLLRSWSPEAAGELRSVEPTPSNERASSATRVQEIAAAALPEDAPRVQVTTERSEAPASAPALRLRFMAGSSGLPAAGLRVDLVALAPAGQAEEPGAQATCSGISDPQGFLNLPAELRASGFFIRARDSQGQQRWAEPQTLKPETLAAAGSPLEVPVFGIWAVITALVIDEQEQPVAGASVQFDFESPALAFSTRDASTRTSNTDAQGLARCVLHDPASLGGRMRLKARTDDERFSAEIELPPPLASTQVRLILSTTAGATLRVVGADGAPVSGAMARLERLEPPFASSGRSTDLQGAAKFKPLEPGRYAASAQDPATSSRARQEFLLASCQLADVRLELPSSALPLAVAGSVRALDGRAVTWLAVSICVDGREEARVATDAEGRYRYHRAPCKELRVRLRTPFDGPCVEPELIDAPFGATQADFVLGDAPRMGYSSLRVVERDSGVPLSGAAVAVFRDSAAERVGGVVSTMVGSAMHLGTNEEGLVFVPSGSQMPSAHIVVEKRGFVRRELELSAIAQLPAIDGHAVLELERGWRQSWVVLDQITGRPVVGAIATRGLDPFTGQPIEEQSNWPPSAPSDERGVLELALPAAPRRIRIEAPGYQPRIVDVFQGPSLLVPAVPLGDAILLEALALRAR